MPWLPDLGQLPGEARRGAVALDSSIGFTVPSSAFQLTRNNVAATCTDEGAFIGDPLLPIPYDRYDPLRGRTEPRHSQPGVAVYAEKNSDVRRHALCSRIVCGSRRQ